MGPPESTTIEGLVDPSAGESYPLVGAPGGLLGMIEWGMFDDTVIIK